MEIAQYYLVPRVRAYPLIVGLSILSPESRMVIVNLQFTTLTNNLILMTENFRFKNNDYYMYE